jgi:hypothetical protein
VDEADVLRRVRQDLAASRAAIERLRKRLAREEARAAELALLLAELRWLHAEQLIDEALQETFPASDAPAPAVEALLED